jgi:hypothetical protein
MKWKPMSASDPLRCFRALRYICFFSCLVCYSQQTLSNGIALPTAWPPRDIVLTDEPQPDPPYLLDPPAVIPIDGGRQLFVDDFLIDKSDLRRTFHQAELYKGNPVLRPDRPWEAANGVGSAMPFSDGVFYDPKDKLFKLWYHGQNATLLATSRNGVQWEKPIFDVKPGTNVVRSGPQDSSTVWLDLDEKNPKARYKLGYSLGHLKPFVLHISEDGVHWGGPVAQSIPTGDRATFFRNPFRNVWVYSLRDHDGTLTTLAEKPGYIGRLRTYWENASFVEGANWKAGQPVLWSMADRLDPRSIAFNVKPQLYNLDAVAYESLMVGLFTIWSGQPADSEKPNYVTVGFSRDGFHWTRPDRRPFLPTSGKIGDWNYANVQSAGGVCLVVGDRLYFYMSGRAGVAGRRASGDTFTGLATIRRDGFVSLDADFDSRIVTTRQVIFKGKALFLNADAARGEVRVEVLDAKGAVVPGYSAAESIALHSDNTLAAVKWKRGADLSKLAGKPVKFRFILRNARLFSFWVSPDDRGSSQGYVAAGGPGYQGSRDTEGVQAYQCCRPDVW